ncbi:MAG: TVP38/TMEM64 family protein [Clostridia bacterium]|nr:TVP38/TMEM64 family protein [Clostridia bacterium]
MNNKTRKFFSGRNIYLGTSLLIFIVLMLIGTVTLGPKIVDIARDPEKFQQLLGTSPIKSSLIFLSIQFVQVVFAFIPGEFIEVGAGYAFGWLWGTLLCLLGVAIATFVIFSLTRLLGRRFTNIMIDSKDLKRLKFLNDEKKLTFILFLLYFIPGTPKDLITYFAGVTKIKFGTFMIISTFCRIPSVLTSTLAGDSIVEEKYLQSIIIFAVTGVIGIGGYILYNHLSKKHTSEKTGKK